jgi:hypothetical protein
MSVERGQSRRRGVGFGGRWIEAKIRISRRSVQYDIVL